MFQNSLKKTVSLKNSGSTNFFQTYYFFSVLIMFILLFFSKLCRNFPTNGVCKKLPRITLRVACFLRENRKFSYKFSEKTVSNKADIFRIFCDFQWKNGQILQFSIKNHIKCNQIQAEVRASALQREAAALGDEAAPCPKENC